MITPIKVDVEKIKTVLNEKEKLYFNNIINQDKNNIVAMSLKLLDEILEDGQINIYDIPNIILYVCKFFKQYFNTNKEIDIFKIIRYTTEVIILSYSGFIDVKKEEIILFNKIIDVSIELLKINPDIFIQRCYFKFCLCNKRKKD